MNIFWGFINLLITDSPSFLLMYYPFRGNLKYKAHWVVALNFGALLLQIIVYFLTAEQNLSFALLQAYKLLLAIPCIIIALLVIDANKFKVLYFIAIMLAYLAVATKTANSLACYLYDSPNYFQFDIVNLVVLVLTVPLMLYFTNSILAKTNMIIDGINADIWKIIWVIPMLFLLLCLAFNIHLEQSVLVQPLFLVINFLTIAGILISSFVLVKIMQISVNYATLKENARMTEQQLILQGDQYEKLAENITKSRIERHDMRHQLAALKGYLNKGDVSGADKYCDELNKSIPIDYERVICENFAVNALALHYLTIAENEKISVTLGLNISEKNGEVTDKDLCIIIGNFFENAIEACCRTSDGERFIKLKSSIKSDYLIIVMDNSFNGDYKLEGNTYFSQKHEGIGIGLSSVKSVAEKYGGSVQFEPDGNVFLSSAMVIIKGATEINDCNICEFSV